MDLSASLFGPQEETRRGSGRSRASHLPVEFARCGAELRAQAAPRSGMQLVESLVGYTRIRGALAIRRRPGFRSGAGRALLHLNGHMTHTAFTRRIAAIPYLAGGQKLESLLECFGAAMVARGN
jgi:hypothetical protein